MSHRLRNAGVLALLTAVVLAVGVVGPNPFRDTAEADVAAPGGISAMPSAAPAIPGVMNQGIPAIIRASGPGNVALVSVFCDRRAQAPGPGFVNRPCAGESLGDTWRPMTFELTRVYPPDGSPNSVFHATGTTELTCVTSGGPFPAQGGGPCDYSERFGVVVVQVDGGGVNEIVRVTATDAAGESRSVDIVVVETILAWGPSGILSTAAQHEPAFISYACSDIGRTLLPRVVEENPGPDDDVVIPLSLAAEAEATVDIPPNPNFGETSDGVVGLDDLWELYYDSGSGLSFGPLTNNINTDVDVPLWWCGGDTASLLDDFVDFQTDLGIFSNDPAGLDILLDAADLQADYGVIMPPTLDFDCGEGKNVDAFDIDALSVWGTVMHGERAEGGCDADFAPNGVVTAAVLGNGEVGPATITAQQGGGVSPARTVNLTFIGEAALSVFIEAPGNIGAEGGDFKVVVVDEGGRPVGDETVECKVEPTGGALVVIPQTGTTSSIHSEDPGSLTMNLVPTGAAVTAGEELTLTCVLDRDRSISATAVIPLSTTPGLEAVDLPMGCFLLGSTWDDGTSVATVAGAVEPADAVNGIWALDDSGTGRWIGYSPDAPAASDLTSVDQLQAFFVCMDEPGTVERPLI